MLKIPFSFYFSFDDDSVLTKFFCIDVKDIGGLGRLKHQCNDDASGFWNMISDNENFGIHDYSTICPICIGFCTYEVSSEDVPAVIGNIQDYFVSMGFTIVDEATYDTDDYSDSDHYVNSALTAEDISLINKHWYEQ